jgi:hypothetical protein
MTDLIERLNERVERKKHEDPKWQEKLEVIWGSGDAGANGLYRGDKMIACAATLRDCGYNLMRLVHWSQKALMEVVRVLEREGLA